MRVCTTIGYGATALIPKVLWTDAHQHKLVQEIGVMNVFFVIGNTAYTPDLEQGTILAGVTRDSAVTILREMGLQVKEQPLSIDKIVEAHRAGELREAFGTGTAATISFIRELCYRDYVMHFDTDRWEIAPELKRRLNAIREGSAEDSHSWLFKI